MFVKPKKVLSALKAANIGRGSALNKYGQNDKGVV